MDTNSTQQLQKFIVENNLNTQQGIILFDAAITFYRNGISNTILSEVQIITLPKELVLYIMEFVKEEYHESEMYSSSSFLFTCPGKNILEVRDTHFTDLLLLSIEISAKD